MGVTIDIGGKEFHSKRSCADYVRGVIKSLDVCEIGKHHSWFWFFRDLIERHPRRDEKIGVGVEAFYILQNPCNRKAMTLMVERSDGSRIDFSWLTCVDGKDKSTKADLLAAMRSAVMSQVLDFRGAHFSGFCQECSKEIDMAESNVDHVDTFKILADRFLDGHKNIPNEFDGHPTRFTTVFKSKDIQFRRDWELFHRENAKLQITCRECNQVKLRRERSDK